MLAPATLAGLLLPYCIHRVNARQDATQRLLRQQEHSQLTHRPEDAKLTGLRLKWERPAGGKRLAQSHKEVKKSGKTFDPPTVDKVMMKQHKTIGIVGGLGPFAHIDFEQKLMTAAQELTGATHDQDYPAWILSSIPETPNRTEGFLEKGEDPTPYLLRSLQRLERGGADFAVIACNTAHLYLDQIVDRIEIPVLNMIEITAQQLEVLCVGGTVGLLGSTGTLKSKLYHKALRNHGMTAISPLDMKGGEVLQLRCVMEPIFGPYENGTHQGGGIKTYGKSEAAKRLLTEAAQRLVHEGNADVLLAGCTEIPLVLDTPEVAGKPLVDPAKLLAHHAIQVAYRIETT